MNDVAAEKAIRGPVEQYNKIYREGAAPIEVEDALVETLIRDLRQVGGRSVGEGVGPGHLAPIELPYLQLTMTKLWAAERGGKATVLQAETLTKKLGGVQQIAREHVDRILNALTPNEQALCADIFRNLVTSSGSKIAYPTNDLARQVSEDRKQAGDRRADEILAAQDVKAVVRKLTPTETRLLKPVKANGVDAFELFHDVLGPPVLRWRREFMANARLRAEQHKGRLLLGLAAVFGFITLLALFATGYAYVQTVEARETVGKSVWSVLELPEDELKPSDVDELWQVTDLNGDVRDGFLAPLTGKYFHRSPATKLAEWIDKFMRPMGLQLLDDVQPDPYVTRRFARRAAVVLRALGLRPLTDEEAHVTSNAILASIKQTTEPDDLRDLVQALQALPVKLTDAQAQNVVDLILSGIKQHRNNGYDSLLSFAAALKALPAKMTDAQGQAVIDAFLAMIKPGTRPDEFFVLASGLQSLPVKLTDSQAQFVISPILAGIKKATRIDSLWVLAYALKTLPAKLTDAQARAAYDPVFAALEQTDDPDYYGRTLVEVLRGLSAQLTDAPTQAEVDPILAAIKQTNGPANVRNRLLLQALAPRLTDAQAQDVFDPILAAFEQNSDPTVVLGLATTLGDLAPKLTNAQTQAAIDPIFAAIKRTNDQQALLTLGAAVGALAAKLTDTQAMVGIDHVLAAISRTDDTSAVRELAKALQALAARLTDAQTPELLLSARLHLASARDQMTEVAWAGVIAAVAAHERTDKVFLGAIVEVLKYPTVGGQPTDTLMTALRKRFPDVQELKGDVDTAVPWLEKQLGADVVAHAPVRPK